MALGVAARGLISLSRVSVISLLLLGACAEILPSAQPLNVSPVGYADLPGWAQDHHDEAVRALARSCRAVGKKSGGWAPVCAALDRASPPDRDAARLFFETWLQPYAVRTDARGLFTGYYETELHGSLRRTGPYQTPLWQRPRDLVTVDLGLFQPEWKGKSIVGKVVDGRLKPYDTRAAIVHEGLEARADALVWVDDPVSAFFTEIQGSGRVHLEDGATQRIGYDAQNGHAYVPVGRVLLEEGGITRPVTMAKIRAWMKEHPDKAETLMNRNPSVVFFRKIDAENPIGAEGVPLTPWRSLAVDPSFVPLGTPLWLDVEHPNGGRLQRLVIAQDTGGAIKGPLRGDFFWGSGPEAEALAGRMQSQGTYYLLLPRP